MATEELNEEVEPRLVEQQLWKTIAGNIVDIPTVGSTVCYFPHGHAEHSIPVTDLSDVQLRRNWSICRVTDVKLCANRDSDEVYYKSVLVPIPFNSPHVPDPPEVVEQRMDSFAKILTQSDANNGGGFSVPKFCADSILPKLNFNVDRPDQTLSPKDVQGQTWNFRHIYRGTPRRHLLTTGWSKFVNAKRLIAGDSAVFAKNQANDLFIGVRRGNNVFRKISHDKVTPDSVMEAVRNEEMDHPFVVTFYPRGATDFVVKAKVVEESLKIHWTPGLRVRMARQSDDFTRTSWYQGTVSSVRAEPHGPLLNSPWRSLEVAWDDPELLHISYVSPWQVEVVPASVPVAVANNMLLSLPHFTNITYPQNKKHPIDGQGNLHRLLISNEERNMLVPTSGNNTSVVGVATFSLLNKSIFPVSMQGARQNVVSVLPNDPENMRSVYPNFLCDNTFPTIKDVSEELSNSSPRESESLSPPSHASVLGSSDSTKSGSSFLLFGKMIETAPPAVPCKKCQDMGVCYCKSCPGEHV